MRNSSFSSPPGPIKHLAAHSAAWPSLRTPAAAPAPGLAPLQPLYRAVPGPGDLIVLEHSSYRQIFQCPLSLVSNLRICWSTVGCSLCSSDQLGISLALRGSEFCSHLCCRHLLRKSHTLYVKTDCDVKWKKHLGRARIASGSQTHFLIEPSGLYPVSSGLVAMSAGQRAILIVFIKTSSNSKTAGIIP